VTSPGDEPVEVVDEAGVVLRVVTRAEMRAGNLRHRSTYVVVRTTAGAVVAHRRADHKDVWPGLWDLAFGGVAGVGEPWRVAACRELAEEAGVAVSPEDLVDLTAGAYADAHVALVGRAYTVVHDGPYTCPDGEVVELARVPLRLLPDWLVEHPLCPDTWALVVPAVLALPAHP
jgi:8-oxo-dGTP pyrophosphatase MutT (NUDIX family)